MQHKLFTPPIENQSLDNKDKKFLNDSICNMQKLGEFYKNYRDELKKNIKYIAPEERKKKEEPELEQWNLAIENNQKRIDTLGKILKDEAITEDEKKLVLEMPVFQNTIVEHYKNIISNHSGPGLGKSQS